MKTVRMLFGLFVLAAAVYMGWKVLPSYFASYQLEEDMDDAARMGTVDIRKSPEDIKLSILEKAQAREIPIKAEDIIVTRNGSDVSISAEYIVHVDIPVYPFDMKFTPSSKREGMRLK